MKLIKQACLLALVLMLSGCVSVGSGHLRRNCSIGLINVDVDNLSGLQIHANSFQVGLDALRGAAQSRGKTESTYEWWPSGDAPDSIEFQLRFKDGTQITKSTTIGELHYNRFGLNGVYLVNKDKHYCIESRYGFVSEYEQPRIHSGAVNTWYFGKNGDLKTMNHTQYMSDSQICLFYTNYNHKVVFQQISYVNDAKPFVYMRYAETGELNEIEVYHHNHPMEFRVHYSPDKTIKQVTRNAVTYHPGGVLRQKVDEVDITDQPTLYQECKFPDLSFLNQTNFDPEQELAIRNIKLKKPDL